MISSVDAAEIVSKQMKKIRVTTKELPDQPLPGKNTPPTTIDNIQFLLTKAGVTAKYNIIKKRAEFRDSEGNAVSDNEILNLAALNHFRTMNVGTFALEVAQRNSFNPVAEWIASRPWDGIDRLSALYSTVVAQADYPQELKETLLRRWLLSAVAAARKPGQFRARGVLTLQGAQGIGKTSWGRRLISGPSLCAEAFKSDHHMDGGSKDSVLGAISHWIVEIGELDSSFKKDVARLKGFLTGDYDKMRAPYARSAMDHPRQTVFLATVNDTNFLVDTTGNSRWWTIPVERLNFQHDVDMQQVFAQLAVELESGAEWWLTADEDRALEEQNRKHLSVSAIRERILDKYEAAERGEKAGSYITPMELLNDIGFKSASNIQCKEAAAVLRDIAGEPKRVQGRAKWRVKARQEVIVAYVPIGSHPPECEVNPVTGEVF